MFPAATMSPAPDTVALGVRLLPMLDVLAEKVRFAPPRGVYTEMMRLLLLAPSNCCISVGDSGSELPETSESIAMKRSPPLRAGNGVPWYLLDRP